MKLVSALIITCLSLVSTLASAAEVIWQSDSYSTQNLCVRDKNGALGGYSAKFSVMEAESQEVYTQVIYVAQDNVGCVHFPYTEDKGYFFKKKNGETLYSVPKQMGEYYWKVEVRGNVVIKGRFILGLDDLDTDNTYYNLN
jgi:hypothetical protein